MIILAQAIEESDCGEDSDNSFFVGMSKQEYYTQIKPIFDRIERQHNMLDERRIDDEYGWFIEYPNRAQEAMDMFDIDRVFEAYVCIRRDLKDGTLTWFSYPFNGHWYMSPWQLYPNHEEIKSVEQIKNMPLYDWKNKAFICQED